jgi:hypothetical protein
MLKRQAAFQLPNFALSSTLDSPTLRSSPMHAVVEWFSIRLKSLPWRFASGNLVSENRAEVQSRVTSDSPKLSGPWRTWYAVHGWWIRADDAVSREYNIFIEAQGGIGLHWIGVYLIVQLSPARLSFPLTRRQNAMYFVDNSTEQYHLSLEFQHKRDPLSSFYE